MTPVDEHHADMTAPRRFRALHARLSIATMVLVILLVSWMQVSDMSRWSAFEYLIGSTAGYAMALPGLLTEATVSNHLVGGVAAEPLRSAIRILSAGLFWSAVVYVGGALARVALRVWRRS